VPNPPLHNKALAYRPDIDGLRAVAVLSVIAFHFGIFHLTGGFVGVDVFFVISGYLISFIVFSDVANSRFSVVGFYERRIRRIFPALFAMLLVLSAFAMAFFLPAELVDLSKSVLASAFSASNFYFWAHTGYFDVHNPDPLLHTWSLAVEEQFYILFPIFLVVVRRFFNQWLRASVVLLFAVSLLSSVAVVYSSPVTAFFMPYTRAWELLLGTMISLGMFPRMQSRWLRNLAALCGLGMIAGADFLYTSGTLFPGASALLPCIGAVLIVGAGESGSSAVYALLAWRPFVFVGLISYSLYLWHWPVLLVYQMGLIDLNSAWERHFGTVLSVGRFEHVAILLLSFGLAILSWRFVERPFRKGRLRLGGSQLFATAAAVMLVCVLFSSFVLFTRGLPGRFSAQTVQIASHLDRGDALENAQKAMRLGTCFLDQNKVTTFNLTSCLGEDATRKNYLLLGDSHAAAIWLALSESLPSSNVMQATVGGCEPTLHHAEPGLCRNVMDYVFGKYLPTHPVQSLILEADWNAGSIAPLEETLAWAKIHQVPVVVMGCVPTYDAPLARLLAYTVAWNEPDLANKHLVHAEETLDVQLRAVVRDKWHMPFVSLYDALCERGTCIEYVDAARTIPLMNDRDHFNPSGSLFVVHRLLANGELQKAGL
jgi:peptidoglycan/LPS O-acetylase OafA/YrhL